MQIGKAQKLKIGSIVHCPEDRDESAYIGTVTHVSDTVYRNIHNVPFIWVTVRSHFVLGHKEVWPSNRL